MRLQGASSGCLIAALVFCIIGVAFVGMAQGDIRAYRDSSSWQTASGEIISSHVGSSSDSDGSTSYRAEISYFYFVGDQRYTGDRYKFGHIVYGGRGGAEDAVDRYPEGSQVEVLYDPDNPRESVIERQLGGELMIFAGVGACFLLITPLILVVGLFSPVLRFLRS